MLFWLLRDPRASAYATTSTDWLMLAQLELKAIRHRNVILARMKELGVKTKRQERCAFSITEDHLSRHGVGFDHDAGTIVPCSVRVNPHDSQVGEIRPVTHGQEISGLLGLMAAASNMVTFGLLSAETRFSCSRSRGAAGAGAGSSLSSRTLATDASLNGWGAVMSGRLAHSLWSGCHLMWNIITAWRCWLCSSIKHFLPGIKRSSCVGTHWQHSGGLLYQPPRRWLILHQILGWSQGKVLLLRTVHIPGHLNMVVDILSRQGPSPGGMDASPRGGEADLESLARLRWTCLWLKRHRTVPSGSLWPIQLHGGWKFCRECAG